MSSHVGGAAINSNFQFIASKAVTFSASTTGSLGAHTLFTVTGDVLATLYIICNTTATSGGLATISFGSTNNPGYIINAQAFSIALVKGTANTFTGSGNDMILDQSADALVTNVNGASLIYTVGTATLTGGAMTVYCLWRPLSSDGNVVAA